LYAACRPWYYIYDLLCVDGRISKNMYMPLSSINHALIKEQVKQVWVGEVFRLKEYVFMPSISAKYM